MPDIDLNNLEKLAKKASPGPWYVSGPLHPEECGMPAGVGPSVTAGYCNDDPDEYDDPGLPIEVCDCGPYGWGPGLDDAEYIAAVSPDVMQVLVERLRAAEKILQDFVDKCDRGEARSVRTYRACAEWLRGETP